LQPLQTLATIKQALVDEADTVKLALAHCGKFYLIIPRIGLPERVSTIAGVIENFAIVR
jgi:hypothetical protein